MNQVLQIESERSELVSEEKRLNELFSDTVTGPKKERLRSEIVTVRRQILDCQKRLHDARAALAKRVSERADQANQSELQQALADLAVARDRLRSAPHDAGLFGNWSVLQRKVKKLMGPVATPAGDF